MAPNLRDVSIRAGTVAGFRGMDDHNLCSIILIMYINYKCTIVINMYDLYTFYIHHIACFDHFWPLQLADYTQAVDAAGLLLAAWVPWCYQMHGFVWKLGTPRSNGHPFCPLNMRTMVLNLGTPDFQPHPHISCKSYCCVSLLKLCQQNPD